MQSSDRTYQFISDPTHKENLSGRVTAACLNCRKKKIKCSGEESCKQCNEKGLVCEGPPSRKRPRRDSGPPSNVSSSLASTKAHNPSFEISAREQRRPSIPLQHEDSGYSSLRRSTPTSHSPDFPNAPEQEEPPRAFESAATITRGTPGYRTTPPSRSHSVTAPTVAQFTFSADYNTHWDGTKASSAGAMPTEWGFAQPRLDSRVHAHSQSNAFTSTRSNSSRGHSISDSRTGMPTRTTGATQGSDLWPVQQHAHMPQSDLINAAMALEEEARILRHLALQEKNHVPEQQAGDQQNLLVQSPLVDPSQQFDPTTFFRADGTMRDDLTPVMGGQVANWWNLSGQNQQPLYDHALDGTIPNFALSINTNQLPGEIPGGVDDSSPSATSGKAPGRMQRAFQGQLDPRTEGGSLG
ncbi:hypothetical protein LTR78_004813 [Recurvomyces mirabilis]|uniref:Zn(2)-C6 fungal-type domain-containing protein n=1 Tax=Recurvomyces mirabilis TaxID=574656 RepID=A0AAE1C253_9PEZI|nr:hypothetical protein LTR78_004813 [Recurvomyces mirabilis]KAK5157984.1 hypothetical protein LTS14_003907 [Recurvomyces mirabilis]